MTEKLTIKELRAKRVQDGKLVTPVYGEDLWVAMIKDKNDLHKRQYHVKKLQWVCWMLMVNGKLSAVEEDRIAVQHGIGGGYDDLPDDLNDLVEIYNSLYQSGVFSDEDIEFAWRSR